MHPPDRDERLMQARRVRKRQDFLRIQSTGRKVRSFNMLVVFIFKETGEESRLGITTTRKIDKRAARRNRFKRRVREYFRRERRRFERQADIVVIALEGACELSYDEIAFQLRFAMRKVGVLPDRRRPRE